MHLALTGLFRAKGSADVHEEWISAVSAERPDWTREKLARTRALMDLHAVDALVTGYADLIPALELPDPNDRHVLAAAIRGQANVIVTMNLRDFPAEVLRPFGIDSLPASLRPLRRAFFDREAKQVRAQHTTILNSIEDHRRELHGRGNPHSATRQPGHGALRKATRRREPESRFRQPFEILAKAALSNSASDSKEEPIEASTGGKILGSRWWTLLELSAWRRASRDGCFPEIRASQIRVSYRRSKWSVGDRPLTMILHGRISQRFVRLPYGSRNARSPVSMRPAP
jgi:hypothetical protein